MKIKTFTIAFGMLLCGAALSAQDTLFYYGWEPGTTPGPIGEIWNNTGTTWTWQNIVNDTTINGEVVTKHSGTGCFYANVASNTTQQWDNQGVFESITVEDSSAYRFTMWARAVQGTNTAVNITCGQYTTWAELTRKSPVLFTEEWARYYLQVYIKKVADLQLHQVVTDGDTTYVPNQIRFPIHYYNQGMYFVDDVSVLKSTIAYAVGKGNTVTINFGWKLDWYDPPEINKDAFSVTVNGSPVTIESVAMRDLGDLVEPWVDLTLDANILEGDVVRVSCDGTSNLTYTGLGPITDDVGSVAAFTDEVVEYGEIVSPVGIKDAEYSNVNIASDGINLRIMDITGIQTASIYSISGQLIRKVDKAFDAIAIDDLTQGAYIIKVETGNGTYTGKFIK
jgi:hypothetical protein